MQLAHEAVATDTWWSFERAIGEALGQPPWYKSKRHQGMVGHRQWGLKGLQVLHSSPWRGSLSQSPLQKPKAKLKVRERLESKNFKLPFLAAVNSLLQESNHELKKIFLPLQQLTNTKLDLVHWSWSHDKGRETSSHWKRHKISIPIIEVPQSSQFKILKKPTFWNKILIFFIKHCCLTKPVLLLFLYYVPLIFYTKTSCSEHVTEIIRRQEQVAGCVADQFSALVIRERITSVAYQLMVL